MSNNNKNNQTAELKPAAKPVEPAMSDELKEEVKALVGEDKDEPEVKATDVIKAANDHAAKIASPKAPAADEKIHVLKVSPKHPRQEYRLGRHVVKGTFDEYALNAAEQKELAMKGPKAWIMVGDKTIMAADKKMQATLDKMLKD